MKLTYTIILLAILTVISVETRADLLTIESANMVIDTSTLTVDNERNMAGVMVKIDNTVGGIIFKKSDCEVGFGDAGIGVGSDLVKQHWNVLSYTPMTYVAAYTCIAAFNIDITE